MKKKSLFATRESIPKGKIGVLKGKPAPVKKKYKAAFKLMK